MLSAAPGRLNHRTSRHRDHGPVLATCNGLGPGTVAALGLRRAGPVPTRGRALQRRGAAALARAGAAAPLAAEVAARPGNYLPEMPGEGAAAPLRQRPRLGRGPGPVPPGRADLGAAGRSRGTNLEMGAPWPCCWPPWPF